jgi:hypothetical protein
MNHGRIAYPKEEDDEGDLFVEARKHADTGEKTDKEDDSQGS